MKRRIIAALTALVMVVTMIPASAFAAENNTAAYVNAVITKAFKNLNVDYEMKSDVAKAYEVYKGLSDEEKGKVTDINAEKKLTSAVSAIAAYEVAIKDYNEKATKLRYNSDEITGSVLVASEDKLTTLMNGVDGQPCGGMTVKAVVAKDNQDDVFSSALVNYEVVKSFKEDDAAADAVLAQVNKMANLNYTSEIIDAINYEDAQYSEYTDGNRFALPGDEGYVKADFNWAAHAVGSADNADDYVAYVKGYNNFYQIKSTGDKYLDLSKKIAKYTTAMAKGATVNAIAGMKSEELAEFKSDLELTKTFVEKNESSMMTELKDELKALKEAYKLAQDNYDRFMTTGGVESQIKAVKKPVDGMSYVEVAAEYEKFAAIDREVAMKSSLSSVYEDLGKAFQERFSDDKKFGKENKTHFAGLIKNAIAEIPAVPERTDVAKFDKVISLAIAYDLSIDWDANVTAKEDKKISEMDVFTLVKNKNSWLNNIISSDLTTKDYLNKGITDSNKYPVTIFNNAYNNIIAKATADKEVIKKLASDINNVAGSLAGKDVKTLKKALADFDAGYKALTTVQKADFDRAVAEGIVNEGIDYGKVYKSKKAIEKKLAELGEGSIDEQVEANVTLENIADFNALNFYDMVAGNNPSSAYLKAVELINKIEASLAKPAIKALVVKASNNGLNDYYTNKAKVEALTPDTSAPTAVIKAIDALKVLDSEKDTITKELLDSTIVAYEAAKASYNALSTLEKSKVTNFGKLDTVLGKVGEDVGICAGIEAVFNATADNIGVFTANIPLTEAQKATINQLTSMIEQYEAYVTKAQFKAFSGATAQYGYNNAYEKFVKENDSTAKEEFEKVAEILKDVKAKYYVGKDYVVDKTSAEAIIAAVDAVNAMSDEAKKYAFESGNVDMDATYEYGKLVVAATKAKAILFKYATIEVADVEFDGTPATPAVVVKDANGTVVAATEYDVVYTNNTKPGTATVTVKAKAEGKYVGEISKEFQVIAKELAKVENVKFDTDYGIVRVYFDRTADIEGIDVRYQVQYKKTTSDKWITKYPTKGLDYLTLKGLVKNGKYDVRVRAYTDDFGTERVYGEYSDVQKVYANRNGAQSGIMYKAVINKLTTKNGSVTVTVKGVKYQTVPQGVTWKYSFKKYGSQYKTWSTAKTTKSTSYTFKNLKKGTRYVFRAQYTYNTAVDGKTAVNSNYSVYKNIVVK